MASEKILGCFLILVCFVFMATTDAPRPEDVSYRVKRRDGDYYYESDYAKDCKPYDILEDNHSVFLRKWFLFSDCFSYGRHKYYLSGYFFRNATAAQQLCNFIGGYIVKINTISELKAIKNYIGNISRVGLIEMRAILIDGTDIWNKGTWTSFDMGRLPVIDWHPGNPNGGNCLCLASKNEQKMFSVLCNVPEAWPDDRYPYRFMCEIPA